MTNSDYERRLRERAEAARAKLRAERRQKAAGAIMATIAAGVLIIAFVLLLAITTMLAWNFGVVALIAACGGHAAHIGFATALFVNAALGVLKQGIPSTKKQG